MRDLLTIIALACLISAGIAWPIRRRLVADALAYGCLGYGIAILVIFGTVAMLAALMGNW